MHVAITSNLKSSSHKRDLYKINQEVPLITMTAIIRSIADRMAETATDISDHTDN